MEVARKLFTRQRIEICGVTEILEGSGSLVISCACYLGGLWEAVRPMLNVGNEVSYLVAWLFNFHIAESLVSYAFHSFLAFNSLRVDEGWLNANFLLFDRFPVVSLKIGLLLFCMTGDDTSTRQAKTEKEGT